METRTYIRDGRGDFDFLTGTWSVHNRRLKKPLSGSTEWYEFEATSVALALWGGKANVDEIDFDSPLGRFQGLTLRLYDAQKHEWSLYWATAERGLATVPNVGAFNDEGVGEFFSREVFENRDIVCRYRWSAISRNGCRWDQAFSADEGKTWETNWTMEFTRT